MLQLPKCALKHLEVCVGCAPSDCIVFLPKLVLCSTEHLLVNRRLNILLSCFCSRTVQPLHYLNVYVIADYKVPFVPTEKEYEVVSIREGERVVIPCRGSVENLNVTLNTVSSFFNISKQ